jgi:hypothetical protein
MNLSATTIGPTVNAQPVRRKRGRALGNTSAGPSISVRTKDMAMATYVITMQGLTKTYYRVAPDRRAP